MFLHDRRVVAILCVGILFTGLGCDDSPPAKPAESTPASEAILETLFSLRANQRTLLQSLGGGKFYVGQPDNDAELSLYENGKLGSSRLTTGRIAAIYGEANVYGAIRSLTMLPDGRLLVYYVGGSGRQILNSVVAYDPTSDRLSTIVTTGELASASGMGGTLDLATVQLARSGGNLWLWLRHSDRSVMFRIDSRSIGTGPLKLPPPLPPLSGWDGRFAAGANDTLVGEQDGSATIFRPETGEVWRLDSDGTLAPLPRPSDLPPPSLAPLRLDAYGIPGAREVPTKLWFFPLGDLPVDPLARPGFSEVSDARFPNFVVAGARRSLRIPRDSMKTRAAFPTYAMRLTNWTADPLTGDIVAYDAMSGEVMRIRLNLSRPDQ